MVSLAAKLPARTGRYCRGDGAAAPAAPRQAATAFSPGAPLERLSSCAHRQQLSDIQQPPPSAVVFWEENWQCLSTEGKTCSY